VVSRTCEGVSAGLDAALRRRPVTAWAIYLAALAVIALTV
jgi:hypothetical protein